MSSIFELINNYQDSIIASVTIALGAVQTGVSSWAIHRVIQDEHFLIYILGHAMKQTTKDVKEVIENFSSLKEFLRNDLFEILDMVKIAFSIALVAGICQILISVLLLCLINRVTVNKLWIWTTGLTFIGLVSGFVLVLKFMMPNILYFQVFLATTGVNFFITFHLIAAMLPDIFCNKSSDEETPTDSTEVSASPSSSSSSESWATAVTSTSGSENGPPSRSPLVNTGIQTVPTGSNANETDLPLPPPPPQ